MARSTSIARSSRGASRMYATTTRWSCIATAPADRPTQPRSAAQPRARRRAPVPTLGHPVGDQDEHLPRREVQLVGGELDVLDHPEQRRPRPDADHVAVRVQHPGLRVAGVDEGQASAARGQRREVTGHRGEEACARSLTENRLV